ncbi:hypothetical protein [Clostridium tyrobutyricum]|uniref:hypothetical protein n=1 Tax=Clostridium tyrobutyricum TaxID=1519 RepID=UPI00057E6C93|nr:hypothetical protein [Clostridium tyrobutyricum]MBV4427175.1 hypothetical protein [Clostridium tyrobutyricum]MBV4440215.1 hypothetical protein [Clostridium tyrobutyricum]MBV4442490.1 hypothetical protein [Clostridium tyrobutyricum]
MITEEFSPENIFAGNVMPVVTEKAVVALNQNVAKLSIVEKDAQGNIVIPSGEEINPENAYGIASEGVATTDETKNIVIYMTGEFKGTSIIVPEGKTIEDYRVSLRKLGIFIK